MKVIGCVVRALKLEYEVLRTETIKTQLVIKTIGFTYNSG